MVWVTLPHWNDPLVLYYSSKRESAAIANWVAVCSLLLCLIVSPAIILGSNVLHSHGRMGGNYLIFSDVGCNM